jgi:hypothetical protein
MSVSRPKPSPSITSKLSLEHKPTIAKKAETITDEEYARQLAAQLNSHRTRSSGNDKRPIKKVKTKKKSAAQVGSDEDGEEAPKKRAKGGFQKEYNLR